MKENRFRKIYNDFFLSSKGKYRRVGEMFYSEYDPILLWKSKISLTHDLDSFSYLLWYDSESQYFFDDS